MARRIFLIILVATVLFTFFGLSLSGLGTMFVRWPNFVIDLYAHNPDGTDFSLENFGHYVLENLYLLTPIGYVMTYSRFSSWNGLPPRSNLKSELDRTVYLIYGTILYANGQDPLDDTLNGSFELKDFRTFFKNVQPHNNFTVILSEQFKTLYKSDDYIDLNYLPRDPERLIFGDFIYHPFGSATGSSFGVLHGVTHPIGDGVVQNYSVDNFERNRETVPIKLIYARDPFTLNLYIKDNFYKSYVVDQPVDLPDYDETGVYVWNPFEIVDSVIISNVNYFGGTSNFDVELVFGE